MQQSQGAGGGRRLRAKLFSSTILTRPHARSEDCIPVCSDEAVMPSIAEVERYSLVIETTLYSYQETKTT